MFTAELGGGLLTRIDLPHDVELEFAALAPSGQIGSFRFVSLPADWDEVPCLLVRSCGFTPPSPNHLPKSHLIQTT